MVIDNIFVLVFSSDHYNREELDAMDDTERYELAVTAKSIGDDTTDVLTPSEFQAIFNDNVINCEFSYIYFYVI